MKLISEHPLQINGYGKSTAHYRAWLFVEETERWLVCANDNNREGTSLINNAEDVYAAALEAAGVTDFRDVRLFELGEFDFQLDEIHFKVCRFLPNGFISAKTGNQLVWKLEGAFWHPTDQAYPPIVSVLNELRAFFDSQQRRGEN